MRTRHYRTATALLTALALGFTMPAAAEVITTERAMSPHHERLLRTLDREEVAAKLRSKGVALADAKARIAALSDEQAAQLDHAIENAPAGGYVQLLVYAVVAAAEVAFIVVALTGMTVMVLARAGKGLVDQIRGTSTTEAPQSATPPAASPIADMPDYVSCVVNGERRQFVSVAECD